MRTAFDAIVIGAGPAGSSAAILLARAGRSVALVEKQAFPRRKVCGECIAASNLPLLDALGIGDAFAAQAGPALRRVALMRGARTVEANLPPAPSPRHPWGRALGRETLDTLLLERARALGVEVFQPWAVQALGGEPGDHRCEIRAAGEDRHEAMTLQAPILIAANGSWEALPSAREERRRARGPDDLFAFKANFRGSDLPAGLLPVLAFEGGYGGMVVADDGLLTLACCVRDDRLEAWRREAPGVRAGEVVETMLRRACGGVDGALRNARREGAWLAAGPIDPRIRVGADDACFRIGNAAGEAHPIIGEGMSMAMQSAWLLCAHLLGPQARGSGWQHAVHARYAAEWRRQFAPRLRLAAAFAHAAMRPVASASLVALFELWPGLLTQGARWGGKVRCAADAGLIETLRPAQS
jgi:2-polyprenyl-6-methoxyphenol hydroxylase-like FAD-dependent oxidoreductase